MPTIAVPAPYRSFSPGQGLPIILRTGTFVTDQQRSQIESIASLAGVPIITYTGGAESSEENILATRGWSKTQITSQVQGQDFDISGHWDFNQAPTINGEPFGTGAGDADPDTDVGSVDPANPDVYRLGGKRLPTVASGDRVPANLLPAHLAYDEVVTKGRDRAFHTGNMPVNNITDLNERVQDIVGAMMVSGAGLTFTYNDTLGQITGVATGGDAEVMRDTIGAALVGINGVLIGVNDAGDTITFQISGLTTSQITGLENRLLALEASAGGELAPVQMVQGQTGLVRLSVNGLDDVQFDERYINEDGVVEEPGPVFGEFLGFRENGFIGNLPINAETLGLQTMFAPFDPNAQFLTYSVIVPVGGTVPANKPANALIIDQNNPEQPLFAATYIGNVGSTGVTLDSPLKYQAHDLTLTVTGTPKITLPQPVRGARVTISLRQDATGGRLASWSSNIAWLKGTAAGGPTLETGGGGVDTFVFYGLDATTWQCLSQSKIGTTSVTAGPVPTWVAGIDDTTGSINVNSAATLTWPTTGVANNDVAVIEVLVTGGTSTPDAPTLTAAGFSPMVDAPQTNNDTAPTARAWLYKKKCTGAENNTTLSIPLSDTTGRVVITGGIWRGADFDRVTVGPSLRDTNQDTVFELPTANPPITNTVVAALASHRHNTGTAGVPATTAGGTDWTKRLDHYEGRATDGTIVQYSGVLFTRNFTGTAGADVTSTNGTVTPIANTVGWMVYVAPVNV